MKKELIINTALELFSNNGYANTTISSIAVEAGIAKGSIYTHFSSKEELLEGVVKYGVDKISEDVFSKLTIENGLEQLVDNYIDVLLSNKEFYTLYFALIVNKDSSQLIIPHFEPLLNRFLGLMTGYFEDKGEKDPEATAILFGSLLDGISLGIILAEDLFPIEKVKKELIEKFK